jgi:AbrB family looped-hinge helix DNA binding protein
MSSKNQIVVPREVRAALGLRPGDRLVVSVRDDGVAEVRRRVDDPVAELEGLLRAPDGGVPEFELWPEARCE